MDGQTAFGYNDTEHVGQMAVVALDIPGNLFEVARTSGSTAYDGAWKSGQKFKVPTPRHDRRDGLAREAKAHRFEYMSRMSRNAVGAVRFAKDDGHPSGPDHEVKSPHRDFRATGGIGNPARVPGPQIQRPDEQNGSDHAKEMAALLVVNRSGGTDWGEFSRLENKPWSKRLANRFLLCCLLDYQIPSDAARGNGYRLIDEILGDPEDVWEVITSFSAAEWNSKHDVYRLHRFRMAHYRLWRIGPYLRRFWR
jgi:hypothetical protein